MAVAFFDSGIGGLTVLREAKKELPHEDYIYYADSANIPYGLKSADEISALVFAAVAKLERYNLKALVLACNTATSVVVSELRSKYPFPIIGMEPALKPALAIEGNKKILLCATERTLKEEKLERLIQRTESQNKVVRHSLQALVGFAERGDFESDALNEYLGNELQNINSKTFSAIVLGCTHFIFYKPHIQAIVGKEIQLLDGNIGTIKHLKNNIIPNTDSVGTMRFLSSNTELTREYFESFLSYYEGIHNDASLNIR